MSGLGTYLVGKNQTYTTIQAAIDALKVDQGIGAFAATQTILITDSQSYASFTIKDLTPTSTYRLIIKPSPGETPVLSGKISPSTSWTGITISSCDYVSIEGLIIRDFARGVVVFSSEQVKILKCTVRSNPVIGVYLSGCRDALLIGNAITESESLVTLSGCFEPVLLHNSFCNYKSGKYAIFVDPPREDGGTPLLAEDNQVRMFNNVLSCATHSCIILPEGYQRLFKDYSNHNVFFSGVDSIAEITENINGVESTYEMGSLQLWRLASGGDKASRYGDPLFIRDLLSGNPSQGLKLDQFSPYGLKGQVLVGDPDSVLPAYVVDQDLQEDIFGTTRRTPPTPGVHELNPSSDFDYSTFFGSYVSDTSSDVDGLDRATRQLRESLVSTTPKLKSGYFFIRDGKYYLYAEKKTLILREITWSQVDVLCDLINVEVSLGGEPAEFTKLGSTILVSHAGSTVSNEIDGHIEVSGDRLDWDTATNRFIIVPAVFVFLPGEALQRYLLPSEPLDAAPIVYTDDLVGLNDSQDILPYLFASNYDHETDHTEILFEGAANRFRNADFSYLDILGSPEGWEINTSEDYTVEGRQSSGGVTPLVGDNFLYCESDNSHADFPFVTQEIYRHQPEKDLTVSLYVHSFTNGNLRISLESLDENRNVLGTQEVSVSTSDITDLVNSEWKRVRVFCPVSENSSFSNRGAVADVACTDAPIYFADNVTPKSIRFSISPGASDACVAYITGVMATEDNVLHKFARMTYGDGGTIEYENSDGKLYNVSDLSLSNVVNPQHGGFLTIGALPGNQFDPNAPVASTTLNDWRWSTGRISYLPWSKIEGINKYSQVALSKFPYSSIGLTRETGYYSATPTINKIQGRPNPIVVGWDEVDAGSFVATVFDQYGNPVAWEEVTVSLVADHGQFPGYLGLREMSVPSALDTSFVVTTDPSGSIALSVISPGQEYLLVGSPSPTSNYIETPYLVSQINHGNISVEDSLTGTLISLIGAETSEDLAIVTDGIYGKTTLPDLPYPGSIRVLINDTSTYDLALEESQATQLEDNEFYVDDLTGEIWLVKDVATTVRVTYSPRLGWVDPNFPSRIYFADAATSDMTSDILVRYDATVNLVVNADTVSETYQVILRAN